MALSATLRRAASSAARALAARQGYHSAPLRPFAVGTRGILSASSSCSPSGDAAPDGTSPRPVPARPFSTQPVKVAFPSDPSILQVLDAEIKCAEECDDHERKDEIPDQFPFEIKDVPGSTTVTLGKNYHGEDVKVIVSMPNLVTGDRDDDEVEKDEQKISQSSLPLVVNVSKGEGTSLEFCCTAYPDEVCIDSMVVREVGLLDEDLAYEGPDFNDLDENLQKAFHKYLEIRGISPSTTNYLHEYMINKDSREYLLWLKNVKQFIQK